MPKMKTLEYVTNNKNCKASERHEAANSVFARAVLPITIFIAYSFENGAV